MIKELGKYEDFSAFMWQKYIQGGRKNSRFETLLTFISLLTIDTHHRTHRDSRSIPRFGTGRTWWWRVGGGPGRWPGTHTVGCSRTGPGSPRAPASVSSQSPSSSLCTRCKLKAPVFYVHLSVCSISASLGPYRHPPGPYPALEPEPPPPGTTNVGVTILLECFLAVMTVHTNHLRT